MDGICGEPHLELSLSQVGRYKYNLPLCTIIAMYNTKFESLRLGDGV